MTEILALTDHEFELMKISFKVLKKFCKFDKLKIYETENRFEVLTINHSEQYATRTIIGKTSWRVIECYYQKAGEEEVKLK